MTSPRTCDKVTHVGEMIMVKDNLEIGWGLISNAGVAEITELYQPIEAGSVFEMIIVIWPKDENGSQLAEGPASAGNFSGETSAK